MASVYTEAMKILSKCRLLIYNRPCDSRPEACMSIASGFGCPKKISVAKNIPLKIILYWKIHYICTKIYITCETMERRKTNNMSTINKIKPVPAVAWMDCRRAYVLICAGYNS
jgi:hypothetical protein